MPAATPSLYLTHGGGPCFFMDWNPPDAWNGLRAALEGIPAMLPAAPKAIVCVTAHWEEREVTVDSSSRPHLIYDYWGFPPHTYELTYRAPGDPELATRVTDLLSRGGVDAHPSEHGWDHGVFVPLKVAFPDEQVPIVAVSLQGGLEPDAHLRMGEALAPLREEGVLMVGSGSSYHNLSRPTREGATEFDGWLHRVLPTTGDDRAAALRQWEDAPSGRNAHPREEHLLPLMVASGAAADAPGRAFFAEPIMGAPMSCWAFG